MRKFKGFLLPFKHCEILFFNAMCVFVLLVVSEFVECFFIVSSAMINMMLYT